MDKSNEWLLSDDPDFPTWISKKCSSKTIDTSLFKHQKFVRDYLSSETPYRGILLYHGLGVGKSRSAIAIANANLDRDVVVILPASIKSNFETEIGSVPGTDLKRFSFIHYNGLNSSNIKKIKGFDNKLIIIDEVHNFISRVAGSGTIGKQLYQIIMNSHNVKIVALSGTPIINRPFEFALLMNMIKGNKYIYQFTGKYDATVIERLTNDNPFVESVSLDIVKGVLSVSLLPIGFEKTNNNFVRKIRNNAKIIEPIAPNGTQVAKMLGLGGIPKLLRVPLFPPDGEKFDEKYINYENEPTIKNESRREFTSKIRGLVSYFETYDVKDYPEKSPLKIVNVPMNGHQLINYADVRKEEILKEQNSMMYSKKDSELTDIKKSGSVYRTFSRALCNFAFPANIPRPFPSTVKKFNLDVDLDDGDENEVVAGPEKKDYETLVKHALKKLSFSEALLDQNLQEYGPKMKIIINTVKQSPGTCLIYSVFRNVEGLKILSMAMNLSGFSEIKVKKNAHNQWEFVGDMKDGKNHYVVFSSVREETQILMNLFNCEYKLLPEELQLQLRNKGIVESDGLRGSLIKALFITQSGSEGISLKNVRQVHLMEPYWNDIRVQQVIGRAVRARSHIRLPVEERKVETFMYVMTLEKEALKDKPYLISHDHKLTSDGYIHSIALRKARLMQSFLDLAKRASVDAIFHDPKKKITVTKKSAKIPNAAKIPSAVKLPDAANVPVLKKDATLIELKKNGNVEGYYRKQPTVSEQRDIKKVLGKIYEPCSFWTTLFSQCSKKSIPLGYLEVDKNGLLKGKKIIL